MSVALEGTYLTTEEVADKLGVTPGRVRQYVTAKKLPVERVSGALFFPKDAVMQFARKPRKNGRPKNSEK